MKTETIEPAPKERRGMSSSRTGAALQGVGRVFFLEKGLDDWTHAALLHWGPDVSTVLTEGLPRLLTVDTKDMMECAPWWCGGCGRLNADGTTTPTEFLDWQQAIMLARAEENLRTGKDEQGLEREVKSVPAFVGVHGVIHPNLEPDGSWKKLPRVPRRPSVAEVVS